MKLNIDPNKYVGFYCFFTDLAKVLGGDSYTDLLFDSPGLRFYHCRYNITTCSLDVKYRGKLLRYYLNVPKGFTIGVSQSDKATFQCCGIDWIVYIDSRG